MDRTLIPTSVQRRFPTLGDEDLKRELSTLTVQVAPSRATAEMLIARLHALPAKKAWQPLAKMRYADRLYRQNLSVDDIAASLEETPHQIRRLVRRYRIYQHALQLGWSPDEGERLKDERVKVTPFIRIFEKSDAKELIGDVFDSTGDVVSSINEDVLRRHLKAMVRDFTLPSADGSPPPENTRTDLRSYLNRKHADLVRAAKAKKPSTELRSNPAPVIPLRPPRPSPVPPSPPPAQFFENLWWKVNDDDRLVRLCQEIRLIRYKETPIAASMLLRALLEASLEYHMRKVGKYQDYKNKNKHPALSNLISYCSNPTNAVFGEPRIAKQLTNFQQQAIKDYLDAIVHNRFGGVTVELLNIIRPYCRPIIEYVVHREEGY